MTIEIDTVSKLFDLLERINGLQTKGTIPSNLASDATRKILEALVEIFPPLPPPE